MEKVKQVYNFTGEATLNAEELVFYAVDDTTNPVIDFEQRNIDRNTVEIWTGSGSTGTKLIESTDYDFNRSNDAASAATEKFIANGISIINPAYFNVNLYIPAGTLSAYGDVIDNTDINRLQDQITGTQAGFNFMDGDCSTQAVIDQYSTYNDGAVDAPVDGTGGVASLVTLSLETSAPLIGSGSLLMTKASGDAQGQGFASRDFTIDEGVRAKTTELKFTYKTDTNYVAGDMGMYLYDIDNAVMLLPSVVDVPVSDTAGVYFSTFITSSGANYRLIWHVQTTNALAYTMIVDKVEVGEFNYALGDVGRWDDPVYENLTNVNAGVLAFPVENGRYTIRIGRTSTDFYTTILVIEDQVNQWVCPWAASNHLYYSGGTWNTSNTSYGVQRIEKWVEARNINTASDFAEYASNDGSGGTSAGATYDTGMQYGSGGSNFVSVTSNVATSNSTTMYKVAFNRAIQLTDLLTLELWDLDTERWISIEYDPSANIVFDQGSARYGIGITLYNSTLASNECYVIFGNAGRRTNGGYGDTGSAWSGVSSLKWRVRKVSNGNMAEVPRMVRAEYVNTASVVAGDPLIWFDEVEDTHNAYNPTTGVWTCPLDGVYNITGQTRVNTASNGIVLSLSKNGSLYKSINTIYRPNATPVPFMFSVSVRCAQGDTFQLETTVDTGLHSTNIYYIVFDRVGN